MAKDNGKKEVINDMMSDELQNKKKAIHSVIKQLSESYGNQIITDFEASTRTENIEVIPTGSLALDIATGLGGFPKGRIVEIFGSEASGKSTLALSIAAECQKKGGHVVYIDAEYSFNKKYAESLGIKFKNESFIVFQPECGEQAFTAASDFLRSGGIDLIIIDSVAALVPKAELLGEIDDVSMGSQARMMSKALRQLTGVISRYNTCVIFINQVRSKIGVFYGPADITTGGRALAYYASLRAMIKKDKFIKDGDNIIGQTVEVTIQKNKMANPYKGVKFDIYYGKGIYTLGELVDIALQSGIFEKNGNWYSYQGKNFKEPGRNGAARILKSDPELYEEIRNKILEKRESLISG
jgi:recombination protein RecA